MEESRQLLARISGVQEAEGMLFRYVSILAGSAGMTLCTCFTVFKWDNVLHDAGHGTMFMVFFCWFVWSAASLGRTIIIYMNGRQDTLLHDPTRQITFVTEVFFDAISMWFMVAAYEFQRRALSPRTEQIHRACLRWYLLIIGSLCLALFISLVAAEHSGSVVNSDGLVVPRSANLLVKLSWFSWGLRCLAVGYPACVALWLKLRRNHLKLQGLPKALSLIVLFFFFLNTPFLIVEPLFTYHILDYANDRSMKFLGIMRTLTYISGVAISVVMGFSIRGFDTFYNSRRSSSNRRTEVDEFPLTPSRRSFFVLSDSTDKPLDS
ncbi:hypothetical protein LEN26_016258 [Aphanomyces euteiches]|nr:hypothetical protein LEN26_016258 [Aphanomyces euteiches]KAH9124461.1 hypothetical protein AeMF1_004785 [Aphanomyces euteiches]KAH9186162.1 hypothetical protein AeNC1_011863 [Aphanomyces euteiches]